MALAIGELRLLPPNVLGRFGSSPEPMDNFQLGPPGDSPEGPRALRPAPTLQVDQGTGAIVAETTPGAVRFRDASGRVRPVSPFLEVWARFEVEGPLRPLTKSDLEAMGLNPGSVTWQARAGNLKAFRRTGATNDKVLADTGPFSDHAARALVGRSANFKEGKSVPLGSIQYLVPDGGFPEVRLRFTPSAGRVYGPTAGDPNVVDDVYDEARGPWKGHVDGTAGRPRPTSPGFIFARTADGSSLGYLDDSCDGIATVSITQEGTTHRASARFSSGPPDFGADALPVRSLLDEFELMLLGPDPRQAPSADDLREIVRNALDTVRLLNSEAMNVGGMAAHDSQRPIVRAREPIFQPVGRARNAVVRALHAQVLEALEGLSRPVESSERALAVGALQRVASLLRDFDQVGDLTAAGRARMPAMMRGSDGLHLALTRRQANKLRRGVFDFAAAPAPPLPPTTTPAAQMIALVEFLRDSLAAAGFHSNVDVGDGTGMDLLFADPPRLLTYLRTATGQTGGAAGLPLVVPGDPANSAFFKLVTDPSHPMFSRFQVNVPSVGKPGARIVEEWVLSL